MKFTELADYPIPAGIVTEWTPCTDADSSGWVDDQRPFSNDHEASLRARANHVSDSEIQSSWLGGVFEVEGHYEPEAMRRALRRWMLRHDAFLTTATPTEPAHTTESAHMSAHADSPVMTASPGTTTPGFLRRTYRGEELRFTARVLGHIEEGDAISDYLTSVFDAELSPLQWPHCRVITIAPRPALDATDRFLIIFAADHVALDAYSILLCVNEIHSLYLAEATGAVASIPLPGSHIDFSSADRDAASAITAKHPAVAAWSELLGTDPPAFPDFGIPLCRPHLHDGDSGVGSRQRGYSEFIADTSSADLLELRCREAGFSTQTAVMAALTLAHRDVTGQPIMRLAMPWHTRHHPSLLESVGWYVGLGPLSVDLRAAETMSEALAATSGALREARSHSVVPYRRVLDLLGSTANPQFVASYLDLRGVPGASTWPQRRVQTLRGTSGSDTEVYLWIARVPTGLTLSCRYPDSELAAEVMARLISSMNAILHAVCAQGMDQSLTCYLSPASTIVDTGRPA